MEREFNHEECIDFLGFKNFIDFELKFQSKPGFDLQNIYKEILAYEGQMCNEIE